jgi:hypothetical protein
MKQYIGTKVIRATPMKRREYNEYRHWELPQDENCDDEGYLVEYLDGGKPNHGKHKGYISWSPKEQFDNAYKESGSMTFGDAIVFLKAGFKVARSGWNGKGMWLMLVPTNIAESVTFQYAALDPLPWIGMKTADNKFVPWLASQTDMLAEDWSILP